MTSSAASYSVTPATTRVSVEANAGEPFALLVPLYDDDGDPVEIVNGAETGWSAQAMVRRNALAAEVLHEWTTSGDDPNASIVPGEPAQVRLTATAEQTTAWQTDWPDWSCGWDLEVTTPAPNPETWRICQGPFRLRPQHTH